MQLLPATRKRVEQKAFLREEGGMRSVTEGACESSLFLTLTATKRRLHALSFSRLRRQLPPGGSLWHMEILRLFVLCFLFIGIAYIQPRDYRVVFVLQKHEKLYDVFRVFLFER